MKKLIFLSLVSISWIQAQQLVSGGRHSLALCSNGQAHAWGYNGFGQQGTSNKIDNVSGTNVNINIKLKWVSAGLFHSIFIDENNEVWTCGGNNYGALADGSNVEKITPVKVQGLQNIVMTRGGGEHSLFLDQDGNVYSSGKNDGGQLGTGILMHSNIPVKISGLPKIVAIDAGSDFSLFLDGTGSVWSCGSNSFGQLGLMNNRGTRIPLKLPFNQNVKYISCGEWHSVFVLEDGKVYSCGRNNFGQLGIGSLRDTNAPTQVLNLTNIVQADAGGIHTLFVQNNGNVYSCGLNHQDPNMGNNEGQLGDGTKTDKNIPVQVIPSWGNDPIIHAEAGREHSVFLSRSGQVWGCGRNNYGQLGTGKSNNTNSLEPIKSEGICSVITSIDEEDLNQINIYPNPASDNIKLEVADILTNLYVKIIDISGKTVMKKNYNVEGIDVSLFPRGIYFVVIYDINKRYTTLKFCKY